jgi:CubicO group peptidase (beta-lactamase class C family)
VIAGAAIEAAAGTSFFEALRSELFEPLGMASCGPYAPGESELVFDTPRGHTRIGNVRPPGAAGDLLPVFEPAGLVHCSLSDWARFAADQLGGARGEPGLLDPASYDRLHTPPPGESYAFGWIVGANEHGRVLRHDGGNGFFSSLAVLHPDDDRAVLLATNIGGTDAARALVDLAASLANGVPP